MKTKQELIRYWTRWYYNKNKSGNSYDESKGKYSMKESYAISENNFERILNEYQFKLEQNDKFIIDREIIKIFDSELRRLQSIERNKKIDNLL